MLKNKFLRTLVGMTMTSMLSTSVLAEELDFTYEEQCAKELKELSLFSGVSDTDFALESAPTRTEAIVMLIGILGETKAATSANWWQPFTDVEPWASPFIGYAYHTGLTRGTSDTEFGTGVATADLYATFVLKALGYTSTEDGDFAWNEAVDFARTLGLISEEVDTDNFLRGDVVVISRLALNRTLKGETHTLADKLVANNVFTYEQYYNSYEQENQVPEVFEPEIFVPETYEPEISELESFEPEILEPEPFESDVNVVELTEEEISSIRLSALDKAVTSVEYMGNAMTHIKNATKRNDNTLAVLDMADAMIELLESANYALYMIQDILPLLDVDDKYVKMHEYLSDYCYQVQNIGINYTLDRFSGSSFSTTYLEFMSDFSSAIAVLKQATDIFYW